MQQQDLELNDKRKCVLHLKADGETLVTCNLRCRGWGGLGGWVRDGGWVSGAAEHTEPEVSTVVGDALGRAVRGRGLQHHNLHLLAGIALDRGHGALPFA